MSAPGGGGEGQAAAEAAEEAWGLCPGRPLTGVRTLGDVIGAYRWLKANEPIRAPGLHGRRIGLYQWEPPNTLTAM